LAADGVAARIASIDHERAGRSLNRFTTVLLVGYLSFIVLFMVLRRAALSPDVFFVFVSVIAVMLGRGKAFVRDWAPFLLLFLAWEAMRGVAYQFGAEVQSDSVIAVERFVAFGQVMPVALQQWLYQPGRIGRLEITMAAVYAAHFVLPLTVAFLLWVKRRAAYYHYVIALMLMSFAQFFTAILMPVAPPRFAGQYGEALPVVDIGSQVTLQTGIGIVSWAYQNINANPVAAFPSLHAAYPILAFLFLREYWPRWSWLMLVYAAVVWFAIMYLGHHYLVDALGGLLYAVVAYAAVRAVTSGRLQRWLSWRKPATEPISVPAPQE
jgi:membrane-associated phospholipid phosphatase